MSLPQVVEKASESSALSTSAALGKRQNRQKRKKKKKKGKSDFLKLPLQEHVSRVSLNRRKEEGRVLFFSFFFRTASLLPNAVFILMYTCVLILLRVSSYCYVCVLHTQYSGIARVGGAGIEAENRAPMGRGARRLAA